MGEMRQPGFDPVRDPAPEVRGTVELVPRREPPSGRPRRAPSGANGSPVATAAMLVGGVVLVAAAARRLLR